MKLISLTANKQSFHPVHFKESGVSLILGKQSDPESFDIKKTFNGVGKSLTVFLIHFCLGANKSKMLEDALEDWEFTLRFSIGKEEFTAVRNTSDQSKISLNNKEMGVQAFSDALFERVFISPKKMSFLTFRSLISKFVRPGKDAYVHYDSTDRKETDYQKLIRNGFLLGLDPELIEEKFLLRTRQQSAVQVKKSLEKDPIFREFFAGNADPEIELRDLEDKISNLEKDVAQFKVANDYHQIEQEANGVKRNLQEKKNARISVQNAIENINKSLQNVGDLSLEKLVAIYEDSKARLPDLVKKNLQEVKDFQDDLLRKRSNRLGKERQSLSAQLNVLDRETKTLSDELDKFLGYLNTHKALDEFVELSNYLSDLNTKAEKIRSYKSLLGEYAKEIRRLTIALVKSNETGAKYLEENSKVLRRGLNLFHNYARAFYSDKPGGLNVVNDEGENQTRFKINAKIQDDASDGINEVKIFCYDLTLLTLQRNHHVQFLFHDSRLFSNMDPRQRGTLFSLVYKEAVANNLQYIASVSANQLESFRHMYTPDDFKIMIEDNVVLTLTDESAEAKLLGIEFEFDEEPS